MLYNCQLTPSQHSVDDFHDNMGACLARNKQVPTRLYTWWEQRGRINLPAEIGSVQESGGAARLPGVMALGYIGAFSETLALAVVSERALMPLVAALKDEPEEHMRAAAAWSIGQVCKRHLDFHTGWYVHRNGTVHTWRTRSIFHVVMECLLLMFPGFRTDWAPHARPRQVCCRCRGAATSGGG